MNNSAKELIEKHGWEEGTALAHTDSKGVCEYCDDALLHSCKTYSSMQIDHILPKSLHLDHRFNFANYATTCTRCNHVKGKFNPLHDGEDAATMISSNRSKLIGRVREHLTNEFEKHEREFEIIKGVIQPS